MPIDRIRQPRWLSDLKQKRLSNQQCNNMSKQIGCVPLNQINAFKQRTIHKKGSIYIYIYIYILQ